jgi:aspartate aminotransferase-like enzyme
MYDVEDNLFLLAGPVDLHPRVQRAMAQPAHAHRSPEFTEVNRELFDLLQEVYQTDDPVLCLSGSGTSAMDAATGSLVDETDEVVVLDNGKFGNRMAQLAHRYAGEVHHLEADWGQPFDLAEVDSALSGADALLFTHNESSAAFTHPIDELAEVAEDNDALTVADCITSLGGMPLPVDELGLDAVVSGSQKCLGAPAGLSFVSLSERARDELHEHPAYYVDLPQYLDRWEGAQTPFTPATHLHLATREALRIVLEEGLEERFERVHRVAEATRTGAQALGLDLLAHPDHRSDTLTAVEIPDAIDSDELLARLKERGIVIAGGQRHMSGEIFRVGHMGQPDVRDILGFFANLEVVLRDLGRKVEHGAATRAISDRLDR